MDEQARTRILQWSFRSETDRISTILLIVLGVIILSVLAAAKSWLIGLLSILAASGTGAFLGLLFAIPKRATVPSSQVDALGGSTRPAVVANTSLEEVSDWLTKTIVGIGLVSWNALLDRLDQAGLAVGTAVFGAGELALPGGVALLLAASLHGGMSGYLWFTRHLPSESVDAFTFREDKQKQGLAQQPAPTVPAGTGAGTPPTNPTGGAEGLSNFVTGNGASSPTQQGQLKSGDGSATTAAEPEAEIEGTTLESTPPTPDMQLQQHTFYKYAQLERAPIDIDDWARGMFGGSANVSNSFGRRSLTARVKGSKGNYKVVLQITADPPPETPAVFFLHNTFPNTTPTVRFDSDGIARLSIAAYGAFTVGALTDDGTTELELNLATLDGAPSAFKRS